jgi:DNA-binding transcriptional LysR family regulator
VAENIDVAIRYGHLQDSGVVAAKIGKSVRYLVAAPEYLKGRKLPTEPEDLKAYNCVMFNARNSEMDWDLVSGRKRVRVHVTGSVSSRDCQSAAEFVLRGHGVGLMETAYADQALARGDLVRLLPRWASPEIPVFAVYPTRKFLPPRVHALITALAAWKSSLWI